MNSKAITRKALTMCLSVAIITALSSLVLAATGKAIGELTINNLNGETPQVKVNDEVAQSGHTVFSANTITTSDNAGATINFGKFGSVNVAPNTVVSFNASNTGLTGEIIAGQITTFSESLTIKTVDGNIISPKFGEAVSSTGVKAKGDDERDANGKCIDKDGDGVLECDDAGGAWLIWTLVFGGAAVGILYATLRNNNRVAIGGGTTVVSPTR
jgi:hypothetical protein